MDDFSYSVHPWTRLKDEEVYDTPIFKLKQRQARLERESVEGKFFVIDAPTWVNIMATTEDDKLVMVEQYRHGIEQPTLEIPGGVVDNGETPKKAAKRELQEETGFIAEKWHPLGSVSSNPAIFTNRTRIYWAENCRKDAATSLDQHEFIQTHLLSVERFLNLVRNGDIHHALVVAAAAKFMLYRGMGG